LRSTHKLAILCTTVLIALNAVSASTAELEIFPSQSSTKIDSFTSYEVEITNTGTAEDIYDITSSNPSETRIAPREVPNSGTLEPGQSETIQVWYNPDTGSSEGSKEFTVTATSQANGEKYSAQGTVEIIKDHQVNIQVLTQSVGGKKQYTRFQSPTQELRQKYSLYKPTQETSHKTISN